MTKAGRPRKPTQIKMAQGTYRKDREPMEEAQPDLIEEVPKPPSHFNKWAKDEWNRLVPELMKNKLLTTIDLGALETALLNYGIAMEAYDDIYHYTDESGKRKKRTLSQYFTGRTNQSTPQLSLMKNSFATYSKLITDFGLTPASRSRVDVSDKSQKREDPLDKYFRN